MIDNSSQETLRTLKDSAVKLLRDPPSFQSFLDVLKKIIDIRCPIEEKFQVLSVNDIQRQAKNSDLVLRGLINLVDIGKYSLHKRDLKINQDQDETFLYLQNVYGFEDVLMIFGYEKTELCWQIPEKVEIDKSQILFVLLELLLILIEVHNETVEINSSIVNSGAKSDESLDKSLTLDEKIHEQILLFENKMVKGLKETDLITANEDNSSENDTKTLESSNKMAVTDEFHKNDNKTEVNSIYTNILPNGPMGFVKNFVQSVWKKFSFKDSDLEYPEDMSDKESDSMHPILPDNENISISDSLSPESGVTTNTSVPQAALKCSENLQSKPDCKSDTMVLKRAEIRTVRDGKHCDLCGSSTPAVRCEKCSDLIFCLSCDDMYHRHPKRRNHVRKAVDSLKAQMSRGLEQEADPNRLPVPPPRRRKSQKSVQSSPLFGRKFSQQNPPLPKKEFSFMDKVGSLRRMIGRPLPPVPKDEPPERPPKTFAQNDSSAFRKLSSSCSSYSNVSDNEGLLNNFGTRQSPTYMNEQMPQNDPNWNNQSTNVQSSYPSSLNKGNLAAGDQLGFQGFPTLPKKVYNNQTGTMTMGRMGMPGSSSVCDLPNRAGGMPQTQSIQDLNYMAQMQNAHFINPYMSPYPMIPPWMNHPQNFYPPNVFQPMDHLKRTPSNSSMNYPYSESGYRLNSYTSMGHLHNPMAMPPFSPYLHQAQKPPSPTFSSKSARPHKAHNISGEGPFPRSSRRATHTGLHTGRRSLIDNSSSEEDYYSASDEEELRAMRRSDKGWQCEHCTLINAPSTKICVACCKTGCETRRSTGERRRRKRDGGGVKSPSSGGVDSRSSSSLKDRRPSSKTPEDLVDEMAQNLVNEMEDALKMSPSAEKTMNLNKIPVTTSVQADVNDEKSEKSIAEVENGIKSDGSEPQRKVEVISKGTSPPPQNISTQTNLSDGSASEEPRSGPMYRTSSRSSLIGGDRDYPASYRRSNPSQAKSINDHLPYFSASRSSVFGGISKDPSPVRSYYDEPEFGSRRDRQYSVDPVNTNDYYLNLEELIERRRQEKMRSQGFELVRLLREAEQNDFTADDLQVAINHCGNQNAVQWLQENWKTMIDSVVALVTNYGRNKNENDVGVISTTEAKESLRRHKGNVWAAVTDSVETRQRKCKTLQLRGDYNQEEIIAALTANHGNLEAAHAELVKNAMKPFHMQIWGPPVGVENESGASILSGSQRNNFDSSLLKSSKPIERSARNDLDSSERKMWVERLTGGEEGVGWSTEPKKSSNEGKLEFQPNRNTPNKVNRMGSFSGGSYTSVANDNRSLFENVKKEPVKEDSYVSLEWLEENKKRQDANYGKPEKIEEKSTGVYTSLQELGLDSMIKTIPKFPIDLDQFEDIEDDDEQEPVKKDQDLNQDSVYMSLEDIKHEENNQEIFNDNEEFIDAATESILDTAQKLMYDIRPSAPIPSAPISDIPQLPTLQEMSVIEVEKLAQPISQPPPPPPLRTEASKKASSEFERRARMCLAEGKVSTYSQAELLIKLIDLQIPEADAIVASNECSEIDMALTYLKQDCQLCVGQFPMSSMISMLNCIHRCCKNCAKDYFSIQIRERNIMDAICPFCNEPDLTDDDIATDYFTNLDIMLKSVIDDEVHELFQRKLRDRALMKDPNFRWCSKCAFGFIAPPMVAKLNCPNCRAVTCALCRKPWETQHNGLSCEQFTAWKEANDPEFQAKGLEKHLEEYGIDCPSCRFRYSLSKGGCMHFQCLQCKFDFCSGCGKPFKMGPKCNFSPMCIKLGLHAHHPRNCLFYLRDKDPVDLQKLLQDNNIAYNTDPPPLSAAAHTDPAIFKCQVMEQKEIPGEGLKDDVCGKDVEEGYAGLCRSFCFTNRNSDHYIEYLVNLIWNNAVDPTAIFDQIELQQVLRRNLLAVPEKLVTQTDDQYREFLCQIINEQIPLDETTRR